MRLALVALLAACGTSNDDRPLTVEYVTEAVLAPTCGSAQCHSKFSGQFGIVLDSVADARYTLRQYLVSLDSLPHYDPSNPGGARLITWVTQTDPENLGIGRMPWDAPMPNEDITFLEKWIAAGAKGAECLPQSVGGNGMGCNGKDLHVCNEDYTLGPLVMACANDCVNGVCQ